MMPIEFKAWFDGFSEGIDNVPTQKQWARIKDRVAEIDGHAVIERIFVDRYRPSDFPSFTWGNTNASSTIGANNLVAMNVLGKSEIAELR